MKRKQLKAAIAVFVCGIVMLGVELGVRMDWALILGLLGIASGIFLRIGSLEGRLMRLEGAMQYFRSRLDQLDSRLASTREELARCGIRSSEHT